MTACGGSDKFTISGQIEGSPSMNLYMKYYGGTATVSTVTVANAGKFEFTGHSAKPTLVEIMDNESNTLACLYMANGDKAEIVINRSNPFLAQVKEGTPANEEFAQFSVKNAAVLNGSDRVKSNELIEGFINENPASKAGAMLMAMAYDTSINPTHADSLMRLVAESTGEGAILDGYLSTVTSFAVPAGFDRIDTLRYRPRYADTTLCFTAKGKQPSLLVFTADREARRDSILPMMRKIDKEGKVRLLDFMLSRDTISWRSAVRWDTATWQQAWAPGGVYARDIEKLAIPTLPYFIATDTAGRQTYRGTSMTAALEALSAK